MDKAVTQLEKDKERASDVAAFAVSSEALGMRRDHESIDDFEHLDPESSPLTETPGKHYFDVDCKVKSTGKDAGHSVGLIGKLEDNQNSSEFSLLSDSKTVSEAGNTPELPEEIPTSDLTNKLIDFDSHDDKEHKIVSDLQVDSEKSLFASVESKKPPADNLFDLPTKGSGLDLFNRFEISQKGSDASAMSQTFMEMERGGFHDEKNVKSFSGILQPDIQHLDSKTDNVRKPKSDEKEKPEEPDLNPSFAHIKDEAHDDDSFKDTDSNPEPTKSEDKFLDLPEDAQPLKLDSGKHDFPKGSDFHAPASSVISAKKAEDVLTDDRLNLQKDKWAATEETNQQSHDSAMKKNLGIGVVIQGLEKNAKEIKSPVKPEAQNLQPAVKTESKKPHSQVDDEPEIAPFALASIGFDAWFKPDRLHPKVVELIYWRDPKKSGIVFGSVLGILLSLTYFSLISVIAYLSLAILTGTVSFRVYKTILQAVQKTTSDGHPFKDILELDLTLPQEKVREMTDLAVAHLNAAACELRRLFLVEDLVDSIKFGVLLWCLTYLGAWFNGMTLIIIAFVALFTLPKVYETNKVQIDQNIDVVRGKIAEISSKIKATIRVGGKKPEEKKE